jgi:hypothetical protein
MKGIEALPSRCAKKKDTGGLQLPQPWPESEIQEAVGNRTPHSEDRKTTWCTKTIAKGKITLDRIERKGMNPGMGRIDVLPPS